MITEQDAINILERTALAAKIAVVSFGIYGIYVAYRNRHEIGSYLQELALQAGDKAKEYRSKFNQTQPIL